MSNDPLKMLMGRYRREILGTVLSCPDQAFRVRELQRLTGVPVGSLSRELALLEKGGLLRRRVHEGRVVYCVNPDYPVLPELTELFATSYGVPAKPLQGVAEAGASASYKQDTLKFSRPALARACQKYHVKRLSLFGSVARGDARADSDVDVLVEFVGKRRPGLRGMADFKRLLSGIFPGRDVDLVTAGALENPYRRKLIKKDMEVLYEERGT